MGGFYLVTAAESPERRTRMLRALDSSFAKQRLAPGPRIEFQGHVLQLFRKRRESEISDAQLGGEWVQSADGKRFVASCGTLVIEGKTGMAALHTLLHTPLDAEANRALGSFCLLEGDERGLTLRTDPLGLQLVFRNHAGSIWSSSFLAVAQAIEARRLNAQAVHEYVYMEMPHGRDTVVEEVRVHDCRKLVRFADTLHEEPLIPPMPTVQSRSSADLLDDCAATLKQSFDALARAFEGRIDSGLSGGYDSRLILAALTSVGAQPRLHVYGSANSSDVIIAKELAAAAQLPLHHLDKGQRAYPAADEYRARALDWLYAFDGYPADGVMGNGQDLASRAQRTADGAVPLNGGGGEIFRNFFYLPGGRYTRRQLLWTFYSQFDPATLRRPYSLGDYYANFERKLADCVGHDRKTLDRSEVEWMYVAFRGRFWMARNNSVNNRFGAYLTPLFTWPLAKLGLAIPLHEKNHGRFEAKLINLLAPALAKVRSSYGHDFASPVPLKRVLKDQLTLRRPTWARKFSFALQSRFTRSAPPPWRALADHAIGAELPRVNRYVDVARIQHAGQLNRLYTLELLAQELDLS